MVRFKGRLDHAPIVYALCQIRFSPVEKMSDYVPAIQEQLRVRYPDYQQEQISGIVVGPNNQPVLMQNETRWRFESREHRTGFILDTRQLVAHTTDYLVFDDFREQILDGFLCIHQHARIGYVHRIGLRYVDLIQGDVGDAIEDFVHPQLAGFRPDVAGLDVDIRQQFLRARTRMGGQLIVKVSHARHESELPVDLMPCPLMLPRKPDKAHESIFLDWDHSIDNQNIDPDRQKLDEVLRALKDPISVVFKEAITDHAVERWRSH